MPAINVSIVVAQCFNHMIKACENLSCHQQGADVNYLKLHTTTQQQFWYHVKHAQGVSTLYNQHTTQDTWYGVGQGAGDIMCSHWVVQANSMILAYNTRANPWHVANQDHSAPLQLGLDAFINDTELMAAAQHNQLQHTTLQLVLHNLTLWHNLLKASGGVLNPSKCVWFYFHWKLDAWGTAKIIPPPVPTLQITISTTLNEQVPTIQLLLPHEAHCYLGVQFTTDGNCK